MLTSMSSALTPGISAFTVISSSDSATSMLGFQLNSEKETGLIQLCSNLSNMLSKSP